MIFCGCMIGFACTKNGVCKVFVVGRVGPALGLKTECVMRLGLNASLVENVTAHKAACIELNAGEVGIYLHASAGNRINSLSNKSHTLAVETEVVVVILGKHGELAEIKLGTLNRRKVTCGDKLRVCLGVSVCIYTDLVIADIAAVEARKVKVCVVCKVAEGVLVGYRGIVDRKRVVLVKAVNNGHVKLAGVVLITVGRGELQCNGVIAVVLCNLRIPYTLTEACRTAVEVVVTVV